MVREIVLLIQLKLILHSKYCMFIIYKILMLFIWYEILKLLYVDICSFNFPIILYVKN